MQKAEWLKRCTEPRWQAVVFLAVIAAVVVVPPPLVERLPSFCLNRHIFGWCPGCGSLRALVCLFHGEVGRAIEYNPNCLIVAPVLVILLVSSLRRWRQPRVG